MKVLIPIVIAIFAVSSFILIPLATAQQNGTQQASWTCDSFVANSCLSPTIIHAKIGSSITFKWYTNATVKDFNIWYFALSPFNGSSSKYLALSGMTVHNHVFSLRVPYSDMPSSVTKEWTFSVTWYEACIPDCHGSSFVNGTIYWT